MTPDERYDVFKSLKQGQKFIYKDETYLVLPEHVECYGQPSNAVNIKTGTMTWINPDKYIDLETMKIDE